MTLQRIITWSAMLVTAMLVIYLIFPLVMIHGLVNQSRANLNTIAETIYTTALSYTGRRGVTYGGDAAQLKKTFERLQRSTALPGEAARFSSRLNVALITLERPANAADQSGPQPWVYPAVGLNVSELKEAAALLIHESPLAWRLSGANPNQRAKLAFEGHAPIWVDPLQQGLIAGLRIKSFGKPYASSPHDFDDDLSTFCRSISVWSKEFRIDLENITIWKIELPASDARLTANDRGFQTPAGTISQQDQAAKICSRHIRTRRTN